MASHENLRIVLVQSALVVPNGRHVLDDDCVIRVFTLLVQHSVGFNHVIDNIGLGNLFGAELLLGAKVFPVVVTKVVVACNGGKLDTGTDQEIDQGGLHLGLTRLEVITPNESIVLLGKLNATWNKGILGRTIDERSILKNASNGKNSGRCDFFMSVLNGLQEIVGSVVDTGDELREALSVSCPLNNDFLQSILGLEIAGID